MHRNGSKRGPCERRATRYIGNRNSQRKRQRDINNVCLFRFKRSAPAQLLSARPFQYLPFCLQTYCFSLIDFEMTLRYTKDWMTLWKCGASALPCRRFRVCCQFSQLNSSVLIGFCIISLCECTRAGALFGMWVKREGGWWKFKQTHLSLLVSSSSLLVLKVDL